MKHRKLQDFYKLKDEILGEYYTTLNLTFERKPQTQMPALTSQLF